MLLFQQPHRIFFRNILLFDEQELPLETQLIETGVTPHYVFEITLSLILIFLSITPRPQLILTLLKIDVVNGLSLLTAKPVTYLVNLSEKDYVRKKNKWCAWPSYSFPPSNAMRGVLIVNNRLPKIKAWIDEHNPGDPLIPFSVALEGRLVVMSPEEKKEEEQKIGATSALGKITQAGYSSLDVRCCWLFPFSRRRCLMGDAFGCDFLAYPLLHLRAR